MSRVSPVRKAITKSLEYDLFPWKIIRGIGSGTIALGYHGIASDEDISDPWVQRNQIAESMFRSQLEFLGKNFEMIGIEDIFGDLGGKRRVHLTFDDGYVGFKEVAVPLLVEYGFPASVYAVTNALTRGHRLPPFVGRAILKHLEPGQYSLNSAGMDIELSDHHSRQIAYSRIATILKSGASKDSKDLVDELIDLVTTDLWEEIKRKYRSDELMSWSDLKQVHNLGFTVGAHTQNHVSMSEVQPSDVINSEIVESIQTVKNELGECDWFAYPNGTDSDKSQAAISALESTGIKGAWTLVPGALKSVSSSSKFELPRFSVPRSESRFNYLLNTALVRNWGT